MSQHKNKHGKTWTTYIQVKAPFKLLEIQHTQNDGLKVYICISNMAILGMYMFWDTPQN